MNKTMIKESIKKSFSRDRVICRIIAAWCTFVAMNAFGEGKFYELEFLQDTSLSDALGINLLFFLILSVVNYYLNKYETDSWVMMAGATVSVVYWLLEYREAQKGTLVMLGVIVAYLLFVFYFAHVNESLFEKLRLGKLSVWITEENCDTHLTAEDLWALAGWLTDGGQTTAEEFRRLSPDMQEGILDYLSEFAPYEELTVGENRFVLVHAGLPDFDPARPLEDYDLYGLITTCTDYTKPYFTDRYLVTGHVPTGRIDEAYSGRIYREHGHIAVDCGAVWGGRLGCIRLEDLREFYVE